MLCFPKFPAVLLLVVTIFRLSSCGQATALDSRDTDRLVFCHFMVGIVGKRVQAADYDADMQKAKALGIDAFALNIGVG